MPDIVIIETPQHTLYALIDPQENIRVFDVDHYLYDYMAAKYGASIDWSILNCPSKKKFGWFTIHSSMSEEAMMDWVLDEASGKDIATWLTEFFEHHASEIDLRKEQGIFTYRFSTTHMGALARSFGVTGYGVALFEHDGPEVYLNERTVGFNPGKVVKALADSQYKVSEQQLQKYSVAVVYLDEASPAHTITQSTVMLLYRFYTGDPRDADLLVPVVRYGSHTADIETTGNTNLVPEQILAVCNNYYQVADVLAGHLNTWITAALKNTMYEEDIETE